MKKKKFYTVMAVVFSFLFAMPNVINAKGPHWAAENNYRMKTRHIYFPQQNMYYDLHRGVYIFSDHGKWLVSNSIPSFYGNVDFRRVPQVQIAVNSAYPYRYHNGYYTKNYYEYNDNYYSKNNNRYDNRNDKYGNNYNERYEYDNHREWEKSNDINKHNNGYRNDYDRRK